MRIGVVTPVVNSSEWIYATVASIAGQPALRERNVELVYVIQDGGSTDGTVERAHAAIDDHAPSHSTIVVESQADSGMYDALARGFARIEELGGADWYAYLNAGDLWSPTCLSVLSSVDREPLIDWLMGLHTYYAPDNSIVHTRLPFRYRRSFLRQGVYGRGLPTVQQESSFWRANLQASTNWQRLPGFKVAGDTFLWWSFAQSSEPFIIEAVLGGFRYHGGHLGVDKARYQAEVSDIAGEISLATKAQIAPERALWEQPARVKERLNSRLLRFSTTTHQWQNRDSDIVVRS